MRREGVSHRQVSLNGLVEGILTLLSVKGILSLVDLRHEGLQFKNHRVRRLDKTGEERREN